MKIIDEIKLLTALKANIDIGGPYLTIYRVRDKMKIVGLQDLLLGGMGGDGEEEVFIYGQDKSVLEVYSSIVKRNREANSYKARIKKWRSIAPLHEEPPTHTNPNTYHNNSHHYPRDNTISTPTHNNTNIRSRVINKTTI